MQLFSAGARVFFKWSHLLAMKTWKKLPSKVAPISSVLQTGPKLAPISFSFPWKCLLIPVQKSIQCWKVSTTPLPQWGFWQCLPFGWTTLRGKHCRHPIAVMGVVDTFEQWIWSHRIVCNQGRGVVPYRFSLLVSKPGSTEMKMYNMDCNRTFLEHLTQLINCSAAP